MGDPNLITSVMLSADSKGSSEVSGTSVFLFRASRVFLNIRLSLTNYAIARFLGDLS